jgi:zinc protease
MKRKVKAKKTTKKPVNKPKKMAIKKPAAKAKGKANQLTLILLPEKNGPLVHFEFALRQGSLRDPAGKDGVASLTLSMLLRGTTKQRSVDFHRALDNLGGEIHLGKYKESLRIHGMVLADKLAAFLDLFEEMLVEPAFSEEEFNKIREQVRSSLLDELGSDDDIADRRFQEYLLWGNLYGRMTSGSLETLDKISVADLKTFHQEYFRREDFVVGASGGFDRTYLEKRIKAILDRLPTGSAGILDVPGPEVQKGKTLLLIDKPNRTQAQLTVGSSGISYTDKDYFSLQIANHVFGGGSFSARLMKEVREKRGWSYGAYSWYRSGKKPLYFAMHSVPSNKDAAPALELMIQLFGDYAKKGIEKAEFTFAKQSLVNQSAFLQDTLRKRLDNKVSEAVMNLPAGFYDGYQKRIERITHSQVQAAIKKHVNTGRIFAFVLGSSAELKSELAKLEGFTKFWERKFDESPADLQNIDSLILAPRGGGRKEISKKPMGSKKRV